MAETFPIKCTTCSEIVDVAAHMVMGAAYNCPMCGAAIVIAEAVDFELPCPAEVVVEEQTPERLRLRMRRYLEGSENRGGSWWLMWLGLLFIGMGAGVWSSRFWLHLENSLAMTFGMGLIASGSMVTVSEFYCAKICFSLDLTPNRLSVGYHFGPLNVHRDYRPPDVSGVYMTSPAPRFRVSGSGDGATCLRTASGTIRCANSRNSDAPRYVTQLIRRQLTTMGHNLHDG